MKPCGTQAAHQRHITAGEEPCEPCRLAHNEEERQRRHKLGAKPWHPARCGTLSGWQKHQREGTPKCEACRMAKNEDNQARRKGASLSKRRDQPTISALIIDVLETFGYAMTRQVLADHVTRIRPQVEHRSVVTTALRMANDGELAEKEPGHWWIA